MNVAILSSSSLSIDDYYLSVTRSISNYLANLEFDLVFGACSKSMMGVSYDEFKKQGRKILSFTTKKYESDLANIESDYTFVCDTTFDMKKAIYDNSDLIVVLPGGLGTISEFLSYVEEARSNDNVVPIIVYDEDRSLESLIDVLKDKVDEGFASNSIFDYFKVTHNKSEFTNEVENFIFYGRNMVKKK